MIRQEEVFRIGSIGKTHGVNGELNFMLSDDVFYRIDADYLVLLIDGILVPFFIEEYRFRSNDRALIKFQDIDSMDRAQELVGAEVYFPHSLSDKSAEDNMNWEDFIGFAINSIGTITAVDDSTENVLFELTTAHRSTHLIPAAEELIQNIDLENKRITMDIPSGLLDL